LEKGAGMPYRHKKALE